MTPKIYGYFESPEQAEPTFDPGLDVDCPICHHPLKEAKIKTISLIWVDGVRSYFYRTHKHCYEALNDAE